MTDIDEEGLSRRICELENELETLRCQAKANSGNQPKRNEKLPLELEEYVRYGRQMILPQVGLPGQLALKRSSVLVIGAGGLGCPVLLYLVAAGVGTVGIADADRVDISNLHRQILHRTPSVGELKVLSAQRALKQLNPHVEIECHDMGVTSHNVVEILKNYDIIVDCTDAPSTRYLISDAAVVLSKPLVSGSALGTEGQIAVYGYNGGPCYRCIFPNPPPAESVLTCGEGGILGPVVGLIGLMQALEVIKVIVHTGSSDSTQTTDMYHPSMTVFGAFDSPQWRTFRLRPRKVDCIACGKKPTITAESIQSSDYSVICLRANPPEISERVTVQEYSRLKDGEHILIDVRDKTQFGICSLPKATSIPFIAFMDDPVSSLSNIPRDKPVFVVCRFGNDSQLVVETMKKMDNPFINVKDIKGGLDEWAETFPTDIIPKY